MLTITQLLTYLVGLEKRRDERGATAVEYALVIGLVSVVVVAAVALLGPRIVEFVNDVKFTKPA